MPLAASAIFTGIFAEYALVAADIALMVTVARIAVYAHKFLRKGL